MKRMWLDLHNVLGLFSLPFHIIMALTSVVFAFHVQFYDAQDALQRIGAEQDAEREQVQGPPTYGEVLPPAALARRNHTQLPSFMLHSHRHAHNTEQGPPDNIPDTIAAICRRCPHT